MGDFRVGDNVEWGTPQGPHHGAVIERHTSDFHFGRQRFTASDDEPAFVIECQETGQRAAQKGATLHRAPDRATEAS